MLLRSLVAWSTLIVVSTQKRENWPRNSILNDHSNFTLSWDPIPDIAGRWHFLITVRTRGYIGFGLSETGTMAGADLLIAWPENTTHIVLQDLYAAQNGLPCIDHHSDWKLEFGVWHPDRHTNGNGTLEVQVSRRLNTDDQEDLPIKRAVFVLFSWGDKRDLEYHGSSQRGARKLRLIESNSASPLNVCCTTTRLLLLFMAPLFILCVN